MNYESNIGLDEEYTKKLQKLCGKYGQKTSKIKELIDIAFGELKK